MPPELYDLSMVSLNTIEFHHDWVVLPCQNRRKFFIPSLFSHLLEFTSASSDIFSSCSLEPELKWQDAKSATLELHISQDNLSFSIIKHYISDIIQVLEAMMMATPSSELYDPSMVSLKLVQSNFIVIGWFYLVRIEEIHV